MYEILYDPVVLKSDLKKFDYTIQKKLLSAIKKKLSLSPLQFGKPLRHALKGYWRLRVGEYRVVYEIAEKKCQVIVWLIDRRKDDQVYLESLRRLTPKKND